MTGDERLAKVVEVLEKHSDLTSEVDEERSSSNYIVKRFRCKCGELLRHGWAVEALRDHQAAALAPLLAEVWNEGWQAAQELVELDGIKVWAHTVFPEGHEGNPYQPRL